MSNYIAFDLEGTLSPQDNTCDLMRLFPEGNKIFEVISRYENLLTTKDEAYYEPGDTLAFMVPFLILHNVKDADIAHLASEATLTPGALDLISSLLTNDWRIFCITSACEQYTFHITHKLGIYAHNIACTSFPLDAMQPALTGKETDMLRHTEETILTLNPPDDTGIKQTLDKFFREELPQTAIGKLIQQVKPIGGCRKTAALKRFADKYQEPMSKWVVVGDSIADAHMLAEVDREGGLAIAFNADQPALSHATMSLASTNLLDLKDVLAMWKKGFKKEIKYLVQEREKRRSVGDRANFHWLAERDRTRIDDIVQLHHRLQQLVKQSVSKVS
jgi:energy-converting hydrogenase A subunit R